MGRTNRYRVVVDYFNDRFSRDKIEVVKEFKTLDEAKAEVENCYKIRHFDCKYDYYVQTYKGGKWSYVGIAPKLTYTIKTITFPPDKKEIKLPVEVVLTRQEVKNHDSNAVLKQLIKKWPKEKK